MFFSRRREREVLEWVNSTRNKLGLDPIDKLAKGYPHQADSCPLANSLYNGKIFSASVYNTFATVSVYADADGLNWHRFGLPRSARRFVALFDWGFHRRYRA